MPERRKFRRIKIESSDMHCKVQFASDVKFLNISPVGASVSLNKRLTIGCEYTMRFERKNTPVTLRGIVVWEKIGNLQKKQPDEVIPRYEAGLRFGDISIDDTDKAVDSIEADILAQELRARLRGLRVEAVEPEKELLKNYHIMRIDMESMLIETEQPLDVKIKLRMQMT